MSTKFNADNKEGRHHLSAGVLVTKSSMLNSLALEKHAAAMRHGNSDVTEDETAAPIPP
jgi:hypothetical protein